jgi:hypothetical protein
MIKMVRAAAPALDRVFEMLHAEDLRADARSIKVSFTDRTVRIEPRSGDFDHLAPMILDEFRKDGWGFHTEYDNNNATTGKRVALIMDHPTTLTRVGTEAKNRPARIGLEIPMPDRAVALDGTVITRMVNEAADVVRDLLTQQAVKENPPSTKPVPLWAKPLAVEVPDEVIDL